MPAGSAAPNGGHAREWIFSRSVLRFGLPFTVLFTGTGYLARRIVGGELVLAWPWESKRSLTWACCFSPPPSGGGSCARVKPEALVELVRRRDGRLQLWRSRRR